MRFIIKQGNKKQENVMTRLQTKLCDKSKNQDVEDTSTQNRLEVELLQRLS